MATTVASPRGEEDRVLARYAGTPLYQIGVGLYRRIAELEKNLTGFEDEIVSNWDLGEEVDPEKLEMQERIAFLELQQSKTAERYEQMRQTLSTFSEQILRLKKKLRDHRARTLKTLIVHNRMEKVLAFLPTDVDRLKESIGVLRVEHTELSAKVAKRREKEEERKREEDKERNQDNLRLKGNAIVAGTIPQLLGSLLSKVNPDSSFAVDFLCVYSEFVPSMTILQNIRDKYEASEGDTGQRMRSFQMMKAWINSSPLEFKDNPDLQKAATEFIESMSEVATEESTTKLVLSLEKRVKASTPKLQSYPEPEEPMQFLDISPQKLAMQWTLHDCQLYKMIDPREAMKAPEALAITKRIKAVHFWVANEIATHKLNVVIKKFIEVMEACRRMRNFFGVFTIFDGVCAASDDAKKLIQKGITKIPALNSLVSPRGHFAHYKKALGQKELPSLPNFNFSLAVFKDCIAAPATIEGPEQDLINFQRYRKVAKMIQEIQYFQRSPYEKTGNVDPVLMGYVQALPGSSSSEE